MHSFISDWLKDSILSKSILVIYAIINSHLDCNSAFYLNMKQTDLQRETPTSWLQWTNYITFSIDSTKYWIKLKIAVFIFKVLPRPQIVLSQWSLTEQEEKLFVCETTASWSSLQLLILTEYLTTSPMHILYLCKKLNFLQKPKFISTRSSSPGVNRENKPQVTNVSHSSKHFMILMAVKLLLQ